MLGHGQRGALVFAAVIAALAATVWCLWTLSPASVWTTVSAMSVALASWVAEVLDVAWCRVRAPGESQPCESWLARRFTTATMTVVALTLAVPLVILVRFGSIAVADDRMAPAIEPDERLLFHRPVADRDLRAGAVVVYRISTASKIGTPGELTVARLLATPGDELAIERNHFLVNGEVTRHRALAAPPKLPLTVPKRPDSLVVPEDCYFAAFDATSADIDGQQIGWLRRDEIVSARLFHFGARGVLLPVK